MERQPTFTTGDHMSLVQAQRQVLEAIATDETVSVTASRVRRMLAHLIPDAESAIVLPTGVECDREQPDGVDVWRTLAGFGPGWIAASVYVAPFRSTGKRWPGALIAILPDESRTRQSEETIELAAHLMGIGIQRRDLADALQHWHELTMLAKEIATAASEAASYR